jgi:hypothetical protein
VRKIARLNLKHDVAVRSRFSERQRDYSLDPMDVGESFERKQEMVLRTIESVISSDKTLPKFDDLVYERSKPTASREDDCDIDSSSSSSTLTLSMNSAFTADDSDSNSSSSSSSSTISDLMSTERRVTSMSRTDGCR